MPLGGPVPDPLLALMAAATIFAVMLDIGLGIVPNEFRWVWGHPAIVAKGLFSALVAVPAIALLVSRLFDLPRAAEIGIVLMAISPGAPVALRRAIDAGGHRSFAPALQMLVALLAVVSMPLSVAALDELYAGHASIGPSHLAQQVFTAQLLPLGLGMLIRRVLPACAAWIEPKLARLATLMLVVLTIVVVVDVWQPVVYAGPRIVLAIVAVTALALATGHWIGGPQPATRSAVAICSAARNPGLALLVATLNSAPPAIVATVLAYLVISGVTIVAYVVWRRRLASAAESAAKSHRPP